MKNVNLSKSSSYCYIAHIVLDIMQCEYIMLLPLLDLLIGGGDTE